MHDLPMRSLTGIAAGFALARAGCGGAPPLTQAEGIASQYFEALRTGDTTQAAGLCAPQFFRLKSKEDWIASTVQYLNDDGELKSYHLQSSSISRSRTNFFTWQLTYAVTYGTRSRSQIISVSEMPGSGGWRITADSAFAPAS
jgi:hypothetical protein